MIDSLTLILAAVALLFATAALAVVLVRVAAIVPLVYGLCLAASLVAVGAVLGAIPWAGEVARASLPIGLPWMGAHFRLDALSGLFVAVVNIGAAAASLYALGHGRHDEAPHRILPFYAAFLAGMNLVVLADDAFTFLISWEFMSLSSWALVVAHHRSEANRRADSST